MQKSPELVRHNVYISRQVWGELKLRAFQESSSASEIINYVLDQALPEKRLAETAARYAATESRRFRSHAEDDDRLGRTVYFRQETWDALQRAAEAVKTSVAALVEPLLARYLGLTPSADELPAENNLPRYLKVGELTLDLGEDRRSIDYRTGQPKGPDPAG